MRDLTKRQKEVLAFIAAHVDRHSYPPTIREIGDHFGITTKGAHDHVTALRKKNRLTQDGKRPRTIGLVTDGERGDDSGAMVEVPVVGTVAAGIPILSEENREGTIKLHRDMLRGNGRHFAVRVRGDSMSGVGIMDGDMAVIEERSTVDNGEIAVAVVDDAVTLKRFYRESSRFRLQSENRAYKPIFCQEVRILGRLSRIIRYY